MQMGNMLISKQRIVHSNSAIGRVVCEYFFVTISIISLLSVFFNNVCNDYVFL